MTTARLRCWSVCYGRRVMTCAYRPRLARPARTTPCISPMQFVRTVSAFRTIMMISKNSMNLIVAVQGHHPGILVVRKDNNPKRNLDEKGIVRALRKLLAAGVGLADHFYVLNHWR
jgi:hypothetical protein